MKRETAIRYATEIHKRLKAVSGLIATPEANHSFFRIKRAWLFGSTIKGKPNPNDVDILYEGFPCGRWQITNKLADREFKKYRRKITGSSRIYLSKTDTAYKKRHGISIPYDSQTLALKRLCGTMRCVRFHELAIDGVLAVPRIMIYPRLDNINR